MSFFTELKRRNVIRVAIGYAALSWLLIQIVETLFPIYGLSDDAIRLVITILAVGLLPALVISWVFELTPAGLKKDADVDRSESGAVEGDRKFDRIILVVLALALSYFAFDKFVLDPARDVELVEEATKNAVTRSRIKSFGERSIAVLPFVNMSSDPEQAFFSDGIAEEMLNLLAKIPQLRVISRSSAFAFRGDDINIPEVAEKLNVAHILEGSVRRAGNKVRITVQLIEAVTDTHLWSETYDRPLDDIFAIQDDVAAKVVEQLRVTLLDDMPTAKQVNLRAYPLYLQARQIVGLLQFDKFAIAEDLLKQALDIDPQYIDALLSLAAIYWYQGHWMKQSPERRAELRAQTQEVREQVLLLDPDSVGLKMWMAFETDDIAASAKLLEEAAEIEPSDFSVLRLSAQVATHLGNTDLGIRIYEYLAERDPLELWVHFGAGETYLVAGRVEDALQSLRTAAILSPETNSVNWRLGLAKLVAGDAAGAVEDFERETGEVYGLQGMVMALHDLGREDESASVLQDLIDLENENYAEIMRENIDFVPWPFGFARAYAWIGNADEAFRYLNHTAEWESGHLEGAAGHPLLTKLHDDPRWLPFLRRVGQAPEQLAKIEFNPRLPYEVPAAN